MRNPESSPKYPIRRETKWLTASAALLFTGSLILNGGSSGGAEPLEHPTHTHQVPEISRAQLLERTYKKLDELVRHAPARNNYPFDHIENGDKTEYFSTTVTGDKKVTAWLAINCSGKTGLQYTDWLGNGLQDEWCGFAVQPSFDVLKPGHYTLSIDDTNNTPWALGSNLKLKHIPTPPSAE